MPGQVVDADDVVAKPRAVGMLGGQRRLDLVVVDDPALGGVDEEDASRVQPFLHDDLLGWDVEHPDLGGHHDEAVGGHVVARRAQAVAVQDGADHRAVGERDRGGPVPRLHERGVILVEGAPLRAHRLVILPRLRDHHEDRVRQRAAVHHEELEDVVEGRRVAQALARDRQHLAQVLVAQHVGPAQGLASPHPVDVAAQRVDLAVVGDVAVGVRQRPRRERVGAEPLVHEGQRRLHVGIDEVRIHRRDLVRAQHALVDERAARQARHVGELVLGDVERGHRLLEELADHVELALEVRRVPHALAAGDEHLLEQRLHRAGGGAQGAVVGGDVAPAEQALALVGDDRVEKGADLVGLHGVAGQEHEAGAVLAGRREREADARALAAQEAVGHLQQDAGAVAGVRLAAAGAPVEQVDEDLQRLLDDRVRGASLDVHDEADAAGVVLVGGVVQALLHHPCIPFDGARSLSRVCEELHDTTRAVSISHYGKFISRVSGGLMV